MQEEIIKANHDAGFFSVCTINLLTAINYYIQNNKFCKLDTSNQWGLYKTENRDVYNEYFTYNDESLPVIIEKYLDSDTEIQFADYKKINYNFIKPFIDKYFNLSKEVKSIKNNLINKYNIDLNNTISIYYRGNDKIKETNLPSYISFTDKLNIIKHLHPNHTILVQSDEYEFYEHCKNLYNNIIYFEEIKKINKTNDAGVHYTMEHGDKIKAAQTFLAIVSILSQSQSIILNSSNVSLFICLFRGHANNVHQYYSPLNTNDVFWY